MKILIAVLVLLATGAAAWNCPGHMLVAQVAMNTLKAQSPGVIDALQPAMSAQMLQYTDLSINAEIACWPDNIKDATSAYSSWHYYDQCYNPNASTNGIVCPSGGDGFLPEALSTGRTAVIQSLKAGLDKPQALATASFWLSFFIHLVADAHQPLHMCTLFSSFFPNGDLGGNKFTVYVNGSQTNLHSFCDAAGGALSVSPPHPLADYPASLAGFQNQAAALQNSFSFAPGLVADLTLATWEAEDLSICAEYVYLNGTLSLGSTLTGDYIQNLREILLRRVTLAGLRLAQYLNEIVSAAFST